MKLEQGGLSEADMMALMESALRCCRADDKTLISAPLELGQLFGQEEPEWQNLKNAQSVQQVQGEDEKQE